MISFSSLSQLPGSPEWWTVPHYRPDKRPFLKLFRITCRRSLWRIISEKKRGTVQQEIMNEVKEKDKDLLAMEISSPSHVPFNLEHFLLLMTVCVVSLKNELNELFTQAVSDFCWYTSKYEKRSPPSECCPTRTPSQLFQQISPLILACTQVCTPSASGLPLWRKSIKWTPHRQIYRLLELEKCDVVLYGLRIVIIMKNYFLQLQIFPGRKYYENWPTRLFLVTIKLLSSYLIPSYSSSSDAS